MRVVITGGGTGGHIYPGLAIAEALIARHPQTQILFLGSDGLEQRIVPEAGWPFRRVIARPFPRRSMLQAPWALAVTGAGTLEALALLWRLRPQVVVATGGYVAAPVGAAAAVLRIPVVVQEQNLYPGATNRVLGRWARAVSVPHETVLAHFPGNAVVTGVPVRKGALDGDRQQGLRRFGLEESRFTMLVLGGSQGALSLNTAVVAMLSLLQESGQVQILHQTGTEHEGWVRREIDGVTGPLRYVAVSYLTDVGDAYACADLVICRAGAGTLAEVTANGLPAIAVPYPFAAEGHQEANARLLEAAGAAMVVLDRDLSGRRLADLIAMLRAERSRLEGMALASRRLGRPAAASDVATLVLEAARGMRTH